jgi:hypothetical protein
VSPSGWLAACCRPWGGVGGLFFCFRRRAAPGAPATMPAPPGAHGHDATLLEEHGGTCRVCCSAVVRVRRGPGRAVMWRRLVAHSRQHCCAARAAVTTRCPAAPKLPQPVCASCDAMTPTVAVPNTTLRVPRQWKVQLSGLATLACVCRWGVHQHIACLPAYRACNDRRSPLPVDW